MKRLGLSSYDERTGPNPIVFFALHLSRLCVSQFSILRKPPSPALHEGAVSEL